MANSKKRKKSFTTKNTHIPKRIQTMYNRIKQNVDNLNDGDIAVLQTKLLLMSDDGLWEQFTSELSEGYFLPVLEDIRKNHLNDKPNLNYPITMVECMLLGITLRNSEIKNDLIPILRNGKDMGTFQPMVMLLRLVSDLRENKETFKIVKRLEKTIDWESES